LLQGLRGIDAPASLRRGIAEN